MLEPNLNEILLQLTRWRAYADLLILTAVVYVGYQTLRAMGTWKIALGIALTGLFLSVAGFAGLPGVQWILANLSSVVLVALIVIFQPEIRRVLERAAPIWGSRAAAGETPLPRLVEQALLALAERRWGALVVFPGREPVQPWLSGGVELGGLVSFPLLLSLFDPDSPGHDGAALIEDGVVTRFAVRLPLSASRALPEEFGTRHHAAQGLAEACDALVLAVSEERGTIRAFQDGVMSQPLAPGEVAARVADQWRTPSRPEGKRWRLRWRHAAELGLSLAVAAVFWVYIAGGSSRVQETVITVPVDYTLRADTAVVGERVDEVRLRLAGASAALLRLDPGALRVRLDLTGSEPGEQLVPLTEGDISLPRGVELREISPDRVSLVLRALQRRDLPVKPQLIGQLPGDLVLREVQVNPQFLAALIPAGGEREGSLVLLTTPIYLASVVEDTTVACKIIAPAGVQPLERRWEDVTVTVLVRPRR